MKILISESQYLKILKLINENDVESLHDKEKYEIFKKEIEPLYGFLKSIAGKYYKDPNDREELAHKTMINAFRFIHQFKPGTNAKAWLSTILKNSYINDFRKAKASPTILSIDKSGFSDSYDDYEINKKNVGDSYEGNHDISDIYSDLPNLSYENSDLTYSDELAVALNKLPEVLRKMYIMSYVHGDTYEEIADEFNIPIGTVRSRLFRIKQFLYDELSKTQIGQDRINKNKSFGDGEVLKSQNNVRNPFRNFKD